MSKHNDIGLSRSELISDLFTGSTVFSSGSNDSLFSTATSKLAEKALANPIFTSDTYEAIHFAPSSRRFSVSSIPSLSSDAQSPEKDDTGDFHLPVFQFEIDNARLKRENENKSDFSFLGLDTSRGTYGSSFLFGDLGDLWRLTQLTPEQKEGFANAENQQSLMEVFEDLRGNLVSRIGVMESFRRLQSHLVPRRRGVMPIFRLLSRCLVPKISSSNDMDGVMSYFEKLRSQLIPRDGPCVMFEELQKQLLPIGKQDNMEHRGPLEQLKCLENQLVSIKLQPSTENNLSNLVQVSGPMEQLKQLEDQIIPVGPVEELKRLEEQLVSIEKAPEALMALVNAVKATDAEPKESKGLFNRGTSIVAKGPVELLGLLEDQLSSRNECSELLDESTLEWNSMGPVYKLEQLKKSLFPRQSKSVMKKLKALESCLKPKQSLTEQFQVLERHLISLNSAVDKSLEKITKMLDVVEADIEELVRCPSKSKSKEEIYVLNDDYRKRLTKIAYSIENDHYITEEKLKLFQTRISDLDKLLKDLNGNLVPNSDIKVPVPRLIKQSADGIPFAAKIMRPKGLKDVRLRHKVVTGGRKRDERLNKGTIPVPPPRQTEDIFDSVPMAKTFKNDKKRRKVALAPTPPKRSSSRIPRKRLISLGRIQNETNLKINQDVPCAHQFNVVLPAISGLSVASTVSSGKGDFDKKVCLRNTASVFNHHNVTPISEPKKVKPLTPPPAPPSSAVSTISISRSTRKSEFSPRSKSIILPRGFMKVKCAVGKKVVSTNIWQKQVDQLMKENEDSTHHVDKLILLLRTKSVSNGEKLIWLGPNGIKENLSCDKDLARAIHADVKSGKIMTRLE